MLCVDREKIKAMTETQKKMKRFVLFETRSLRKTNSFFCVKLTKILVSMLNLSHFNFELVSFYILKQADYTISACWSEKLLDLKFK